VCDVAILAHLLALIQKEVDETVSVERVVMGALYHDVDEIVLGDLSTTVKYVFPDIKNSYTKAAESVRECLLNRIDAKFKSEYMSLFNQANLSDVEKKIVKSADRLSALLKCIEEELLGNVDFKGTKVVLLENLENIDIHCVKVFLSTYLIHYYYSREELLAENEFDILYLGLGVKNSLL
jgi:5'-deoxynucleotidase